MDTVFAIADGYVEALAALEPAIATALGLPGHERKMPDLSPEGFERIAELNRETASTVARTGVSHDHERIAREVMTERLGLAIELFEAKEHLHSLRIIGSPLQEVRQLFDLMRKATDEDWANIAARLKLVPRALAGYRQSLSVGLQEKLSTSKRQAAEAAEQCRVWAGLADADGKTSFFRQLVGAFERASPAGDWPDSLRADMAQGVEAAMEGYGQMYRYLADEYLPVSLDAEAAGAERYGLRARSFLGATIDLEETYQWGWDELYRIEEDLRKTADRIIPGASIEEVTVLLESDPRRAIHGVDNYRAWLQDLHDQALAELHGKHFDIPEAIRRIEVMIPPPGGALAAYYTRPSEDLSRPGRTWWPTGTQTVFPTWGAVTTAYHEGVPGHHLQIATARLQVETLSRYQRLLTFVSGHGEGWALYAERLMAELGYLDNPDYYLGMLSSQALRAVRVVINIGLHLGLRIPPGERFHPGEVWSYDLAVDFAVQRALQPRDFMESEVVRYLGWPGQAISYKVGERYWLAAREAAKRAGGSGFDLRTFHSKALALGPMGLEQLHHELGG